MVAAAIVDAGVQWSKQEDNSQAKEQAAESGPCDDRAAAGANRVFSKLRVRQVE